MSKSLGNFLTIRDILGTVHPLVLRWMLLGTHYRAPLNYSPAVLDQVRDWLIKGKKDDKFVRSEGVGKVC